MPEISPELLRRYPHFAGVSDEGLEQLAMISHERLFDRGEVLFRQYEPSDQLYLLVRGEVDVEFVTGTGDHRSVDTLVGGDLLGWSALVEPHQAHFSAVAKKNTRAIAIEADKLRALLDKDPNLGYRLMTAIAHVVSHRLEGAQVQLAAKP